MVEEAEGDIVKESGKFVEEERARREKIVKEREEERRGKGA